MREHKRSNDTWVKQVKCGHDIRAGSASDQVVPAGKYAALYNLHDHLFLKEIRVLLTRNRINFGKDFGNATQTRNCRRIIQNRMHLVLDSDKAEMIIEGPRFIREIG